MDDRIAPDKPLDSAVLSRLKQFSAMNKLKKMALRVRILFSSCIFTCSVNTLGLSLLLRFQLSIIFIDYEKFLPVLTQAVYLQW